MSCVHISAFSCLTAFTLAFPFVTLFQDATVMGMHAKIDQSNLTKPPTMGEGDIDTSLLWNWFNKSKVFFRHKSIPANTHVSTIAWGMSGIHAIHWLSANSPLLNDMDWETYKTQMCTLFLASDWEHTLRMDMLHLQQGTHSFVDFSLDVMGKNNLLAGTDSFLNNELLQDTLEVNMNCDLTCECH
ncbi:hypothetical protein BDN71DRAFT_1430605 [Pleurotus eryngii]|uniref:Uncharacterized protein n=1 Tax=Pleurotus eryngii TaxID=5323 RepID=A0A9P6DFX2_PLEER|nr:hypothetical protein BDN71DRAFT_1430605 [Pleurotus eryngii]